MTDWEKKTEILANVAIIAVAAILAVLLITRFWNGNTAEPPDVLTVGSTLTIENMDWAQNEQTLLLILQENCRFCTESVPFYQKLVDRASRHTNTKLIAVFPDTSPQPQSYLDEHFVKINEIRKTDFRRLGIRGTPTLVLIKDQGKIVASWIGKLTTEAEENLLQKVFCKDGANCG